MGFVAISSCYSLTTCNRFSGSCALGRAFRLFVREIILDSRTALYYIRIMITSAAVIRRATGKTWRLRAVAEGDRITFLY
jgi:hypothetical protein